MSPGSKRGQIIGDINITPLTDIFLVLLIIMMVMAPNLSNIPPDVKAPEITSGAAMTQNAIQVAISPGGEYTVDGASVAPLDLKQTLANIAAGEGKKHVSVSADRTIENRFLFQVLQAAQEAGIEKAAIIGAQRGG